MRWYVIKQITQKETNQSSLSILLNFILFVSFFQTLSTSNLAEILYFLGFMKDSFSSSISLVSKENIQINKITENITITKTNKYLLNI